MDQSLELGILRIKDENLVLPWPTTCGQLQANGGRILEINKDDLMPIWPFAELQKAAQKKLEEALQFVNESFETLMRSVNEIRERDYESSSEDAPRVMIPPVTPHTKKTKRTRARKGQPRVNRRSTRSSRMKSSISNYIENGIEGHKILMPAATKKKKNVKMNVIEAEAMTPDKKLSIDQNKTESESNNDLNMLELDPQSPHNELQESKALQDNPKPLLLNTESDETSEVVQQTIQQETEKEIETADIEQLISLHETLIKSHQKSALAPLSSRKVSEGQYDTDVNSASPDFKQDENELNDVKKSRSMEEQVFSCKQRNPVINIAKLKMPELSLITIQGSPQVPLTLTFDASDEEDIADSLEETTEDEPEQRKSIRLQNLVSNTIKETPVGTVPSNALCEIQEQVLENTNTTMSQSVSLCSSSANTVVLDSEDQSSMSQDSCSSETEEQENTPPRRSTRASKRPSLIAGLASKRLSTPAKFAAKRIAANKKAYEKNLLVKNTEDTDDSSDESSEPKKPKITKPVPVLRKKLTIPNKLPVSSSSKRVMPRTKRNLAEIESGSMLSPSQPRQKYMKCVSPLCLDKTKLKKQPASVQKSRNTFLNRSTASSRARRTPGPQTPSRTRGFAFATLSGPNICFMSPSRPVNLTTEVKSFIRRNTPQKIDYEEQLAEKKQQLEEKQKRERELQKKKDEEKQKKIEEKKRKRSLRLREAAEKREQRQREEKEKQQKQVEQWEKRIADADKGKVLRKKEETAKIKKIKKKQVEAEEQRRREEEERIRKIKQQELEKEQRLQEHKLLKEQEAAMKKQAEQEKILEKQKLDKLKKEKEIAEELRKEKEEVTMEREEEEKAKCVKAETADKLRLQKLEKESGKKRKIQEEIEKKNAEAARIEQERIENEKEAQLKLKEEALRRQEEAMRRKEKEEARKRKHQEAKALAEEKALRRKKEEIARAEEFERRREEIRKEAEMRREEERLQREHEKKRLDEEKRKKKEIAEKEKLRKIQESNERLKKLEEEHKQEKERMKAMNPTTFNQSLHHTPGPSNQNSTFTKEQNTSHLHDSPQSYDITLLRKNKVFAPSTEDNYNIDDIASDDSTDDEDNPRKVVPRWSKGPMLRSLIIKQYYTPPDLQIVFRNALEELKLEKIFRGSKSRYFKRTSSAHWSSPIMPPGHISFTDQCRGFDDLKD
uniref:inner centromere protein B-like n=1 Tax=Styela clava TaxID=7725 RepID=UPI001939DE5A|nr:inner centromere protein B-like [Styela clava]